MSSGFPAGVRDGDFVKFEGWDVGGNDVGNYYSNLGGTTRIAALKAATLQYGSRFFAFNSNGWCKTWSKLDAGMFVRANATLYIRVEYEGWHFVPDKDSPGNDFGNVGFNAVPAIVQEINKRNNPYEVAGFNTNGWIKKTINSSLIPFPAGSSQIEGTYVRKG